MDEQTCSLSIVSCKCSTVFTIIGSVRDWQENRSRLEREDPMMGWIFPTFPIEPNWTENLKLRKIGGLTQ